MNYSGYCLTCGSKISEDYEYCYEHQEERLVGMPIIHHTPPLPAELATAIERVENEIGLSFVKGPDAFVDDLRKLLDAAKHSQELQRDVAIRDIQYKEAFVAWDKERRDKDDKIKLLKQELVDMHEQRRAKNALIRELVAECESLMVMANDNLGYDGENQCPVCNCCGMELDAYGKGHRTDCLAEQILNLKAPQHAREQGF